MIFTGPDIGEWLAEARADLMRSADDGLLVAQVVNPIVNSQRIDSLECIEPADSLASDLFG